MSALGPTRQRRRALLQCDSCGRPILEPRYRLIRPDSVYAVLCEECSPTGEVEVELLNGLHIEELVDEG